MTDINLKKIAISELLKLRPDMKHLKELVIRTSPLRKKAIDAGAEVVKLSKENSLLLMVLADKLKALDPRGINKIEKQLDRWRWLDVSYNGVLMMYDILGIDMDIDEGESEDKTEL